MGYYLNELANLPVDDNVHFYIFVVNGQFEEPLYEIIQSNFGSLAKSIGSNAVIAVGTDAMNFTTQVARKYLGEGNSDASFIQALPALLITNAHPDKLTKESVRLVVPLRDAAKRFGDWSQFFNLLTAFARGESKDFLDKFEAKEEDATDVGNKILHLKPNLFGLGINVNELVERYNKRRKAKGA
jgi:hypothetical protein